MYGNDKDRRKGGGERERPSQKGEKGGIGADESGREGRRDS